MARTSKSKKKTATKQNKKNVRTPQTVVSVVQTVHAVERSKPSKRRRTRSVKFVESQKKRLGAASGGGAGLGIPPFREQTVMKIPATLATNQQAALKAMEETQRRQDNTNNFLMAAMLTQQRQIQQPFQPALGSGVTIEEIGENVAEIRQGGQPLTRIPRFTRQSFRVEGETVRLKTYSYNRALGEPFSESVIHNVARDSAARLFPGKEYVGG